MCLTEVNKAELFRDLADEYTAEGYAIGFAGTYLEGKIKVLAGLVDDGILTEEQAAQRVDMTVPLFKKIAAELKTGKTEALQTLTDDRRSEGYNRAYAKIFAKAFVSMKIRLLAGHVEDGTLTVKQAAKRVNMTVPAFKKKAAALKKKAAEI